VRAAVPEHGPPRNDPPRLVTVGVSSTALASAYGIAVTGTLAIDTILFFVVARTLWHTPRRVVVSGATAFLLVDLAFFTANLPKVIHGGWFPLALALVVFTLLTTWQRGRSLVTAKRAQTDGLLSDFVEDIRTGLVQNSLGALSYGKVLANVASGLILAFGVTPRSTSWVSPQPVGV
jgi:K+ transporter